MPTLDFVADILCPWCFIARRRMEAVLAELAAEGLRIDWRWRPFLLNAEAPREGVPAPAHFLRRFGSAQAAERYHAGVAEAGRDAGIVFRYDRMARMPNAVDAHRLILAAQERGLQGAAAEALAVAFFTEGMDLGDPGVLAPLAATVGLDPSALEAGAFTDDVIQSDGAAKRAGIRAVPAFCFHGRILAVADLDELADTLRSVHRTLGSGPRNAR